MTSTFTSDEIAALIAKLEAATGPDRGLDYAIAAACHPTDDPREESFRNGRDYPDIYTSSIDAALTLVDVTCFWRICHNRKGQDPAAFCADILAGSEMFTGHSYAPAISLCIAALKARTSLARSNNES